MNFFLILLLLDSFEFGYAPKPRLHKVQAVQAVASSPAHDCRPLAPVCFTDEEGNLTCYPVDQSDKFKR
jgi:hypothetical protein